MSSTTSRTPRRPFNHEPAAVTYAREQAGLTRTELASRLDISLSLLCEIEGGTRNASLPVLRDMAHVLDCPLVVLERKRPNEPIERLIDRLEELIETRCGA